MKDLCVKIGGLGALLVCLPVIWRIYEGDAFNSVSYVLWSALSLVCTIVLIRAKKGGHTLMACYVLSDLLIGVYAYVHTGQAHFGGIEWFIVALAAGCASVYVWCEYRKNFRPAVIMNGASLVVAGIPQMVDSFRHPEHVSILICSLYVLISAFSYYGEKPTLNGRLIPVLSMVYWLVIIGATIGAHYT